MDLNHLVRVLWKRKKRPVKISEIKSNVTVFTVLFDKKPLVVGELKYLFEESKVNYYLSLFKDDDEDTKAPKLVARVEGGRSVSLFK